MFGLNLNNPRSKSLAVHAVGSLVLLAMAACFFKGFYQRWGADREERTHQIEQISKLAKTSQRVARDHRALLERHRALTTAAAAIERRMPPLAPATEFINQATQLASSLELDIVQCTAGAPQSSETHATVEVVCRFNGSFANTCKYLAAIDQFPQIAKVSNLEMKTAGNSDAYPVQATFQLYYQPKRHDKKEERAEL
jgi:Tfp pilus assembly protein PilO